MGLLKREEVLEENTWNLTPFYSNLSQWEADFSKLEQRFESIIEFEGKLGESAKQFEAALRLYLELSQAIDKVYTYTHLLSDTDTANTTNLATLDRALNLYTRISGAISFITPEILAIPPEKLQDFLAEPSLQDLKRIVLEIVRYRPHTLTKAEENLLALGSEVFSVSSKTFSQLNNADLKFGTILVDGEEKELTHGTFSLLLKNPSREVRKKTFEQYYKVFEEHKNTIAATLTGSIKGDVYLSQVKKYSSARERALFADNVELSVYDNLIETVSKNLSGLHKYYELRKKVLRLDEQRIYDTYVPLIPNVQKSHPYALACQYVLDSLKPLGSEYVDILRRGLTSERWVDVYENQGKRSGAYSSGCYDSSPYILMNYKEDSLNDIFTLTHEAGHSMHSYFSCKHQPYQDHGYTIFVAEVASTFNEQLLVKHLRELYQGDKAMVAFLINQQIDDIKSTLYRQTMFAEFEKIVHEIAESNQALNIDVYKEVYGKLLRKYFGPAVTIEDIDQLECLRIPHFYSAFYVYKYATGISAAISLSEQVLQGTDADRLRYLKFLQSGGSKYPLELLRDAGVDMNSPQVVATALKKFDALVSELSILVNG